MPQVEGSHAIVEMEMAQARREGNTQYGVHANAEDLIRAHVSSIDPAVRRVSAYPTNAAATATLDKSKIEIPEGGTLIDAAVHGSDPRSMAILYVWERPDGRWAKGVQGYSDEYVLVPETATEQAARTHATSGLPAKKGKEPEGDRDALLRRIEILEAQLAAAPAPPGVGADEAAAIVEGEQEDEGEPETSSQLSKKHDRPELNKLAADAGVESPEKLGTKDDVADAIVKARESGAAAAK